MPTIAARLGIDQRPIDVTDDGEARWLEACVWPDQADRFHRLVAAIDIARSTPPEILAGDAVVSLAPGIERVGAVAHPVVTNSWVLNYLDARSSASPIWPSWSASAPIATCRGSTPRLRRHIPELPNAPDPKSAHLTVLTMVRWRTGRRVVDHLATVHPHGFWMHWR